MSLSPDQYYVIGEPYNYASIYGYPKRRFPVHRADELGNRLDSYSVGEIKEELMLDENGQLWGRCFYTKNLGRPSGKYRFYPSPEALIAACGGKVVAKPAAEHPIKGDVQEKAFDKLLKERGDETHFIGVTSEAPPTQEPSDLEKRLKALEDKVFSAATPSKKATGKSVSRATARQKYPKKAAARARTPARKKKVTP